MSHGKEGNGKSGGNEDGRRDEETPLVFNLERQILKVKISFVVKYATPIFKLPLRCQSRKTVRKIPVNHETVIV